MRAASSNPGLRGKRSGFTRANFTFGWLSLFGTNSKPDAELMLRLTAAAIGVELARDAVGSRAKKGTLWSALLSESFSDIAAAREEAAAHGIALAQQYCIVVLECDATGAPPPVMTELRALAADVFHPVDAELGFLEREQSLFVFVPAARAVDASQC